VRWKSPPSILYTGNVHEISTIPCISYIGYLCLTPYFLCAGNVQEISSNLCRGNAHKNVSCPVCRKGTGNCALYCIWKCQRNVEISYGRKYTWNVNFPEDLPVISLCGKFNISSSDVCDLSKVLFFKPLVSHKQQFPHFRQSKIEKL